MGFPHTPRVVATRRLPEGVEERLCALFDTRLNFDDHPFSRDELIAALREADVLVPTVTDRLDAAMLAEAGPQLRLIASFGAGVDHIDLASAKARGIVVTNTQGVLTEDTADAAMAMILVVPRRLREGANSLRAGEWTGWTPTSLLGTRIGGKALGIVGMGRIGQAVARRALAFGLHLHYHQRKPLHPSIAEPLGATYWESLDAMLSAIDILTLHCPHTPETHHLLDAARLARMKPGSYLVNTARGALVDEAALAAALREGRLAGAGLDVYEHEPAIHPDLLALPNLLLLPHMASSTVEGRIAMGERVLINIHSFLHHHTPPDKVLVD